MNKQKVLIKANTNWADEMDIECFCICEKDEWESITKTTKKAFKYRSSWCVYVGTNEEIEFDSFNEWSELFDVTDISDDDANAILRILGKTKFGFCELITQIAEVYEEDREEYDE